MKPTHQRFLVPKEIVTLALCLAPVFCPSTTRGHRSMGETSTSEIARGGTFRFVQEHASTLDPKEVSDVYSATISFQIHRGLLIYGANLTPVPDVAKSWIISRDGRVYRFELNQGVRFHNGREVTAEDFVYTFERIFRPGGNPGLAGLFLSAIEGARAYHDGQADRITGLVALGRYSLEIRLSHSDAVLLSALAMNQTAVVPREVVEQSGRNYGQRPVGCGPFRFVDREEGLIRLAAFEGYYRHRAHMDTLVFITPKDHTTNVGTNLLLNGECDLAEVPGFRRNEVSRAPDVRLVSRRELTLSFIGLNVTIPPLNDPKVRQAMAMATDRMAAIRLNPAGQLPASAILPPGMSCYSPETRIYPFDLERARSVLAEAGYPRGRGLPPIKFYTSRSTVRGQMVDSVMVSTWRSAGLPVECVRTDWLDLQRRLDRYELPVFSLSWIADIPDPDSFVGSLFASYSQNNYFRYFSAQVDSLLSAARKVVDPRSRQQIYGRIEKTILSEAPVIPLYTSTTAYGLGKQFHELELTPLGISCVDFAHVWMDQENHASRRVP